MRAARRGVDQVRDLVVRRLSVGQQDDVLLARARRQQLVDRLAQARQDVGAAAGGDARDVAQDALPVGGALQAHDRRAPRCRTRRPRSGRRAAAPRRWRAPPPWSGPSWAPAIEPDLSMTSASASVASSRRVGDVEPDRQHRFQARRHVAARAEALRAAGDQQPAALAHEAVQRRQRRIGQRGARHVGQRDEIVAAEVGVARPAPRAARTSAAMCSAASARANEPDAPALPSRHSTRGSCSVAIASTPSSFSGWRSPPDAAARTCSVAVPAP